MKVYLKQCSLPAFENIYSKRHELQSRESFGCSRDVSRLSIIVSGQLNTLYYRDSKLRLLCTETGIEWFVDDLLQCFFSKTPNAKFLAKLRSLPSSLKFKRHIDFGDRIERCHKTVAHEIMWDCLALVLTVEQLFDFYEWFMLRTEYICVSSARASNQDVIDYFRASRPNLRKVAA
jgi:hypothetical protein